MYILLYIIGAFTLYDIDSDGFITKEEMCKILTSINSIENNLIQDSVSSEIRVKELFKKMDIVISTLV